MSDAQPTGKQGSGNEESTATDGARVSERLAIVGSGAIACGLAATAARQGPVLVVARSESSAARARANVEKLLARLGGPEAARSAAAQGPAADQPPPSTEHLQVSTDPEVVSQATFVVEAVVEEYEVKERLHSELRGAIGADAILASTTSSLSIERLAQASGIAERFVGLHVFNPVTRMQLVELAFPDAASADTRARAGALCEALGKTPVVVPDVAGFVVNRLLFPYLFSAVRLLEETGMAPSDVDTCMKLGAGHPMGPLALLDLVGLDVSLAIGQTLGEQVPARVEQLIAEGALGRKSGRGFHAY